MLKYLRYDKYQKVTKYWYEEDLEMEWERERSKAVAEEGEYETTGHAHTALSSFDPTATMTADMSEAARGLAWDTCNS